MFCMIAAEIKETNCLQVAVNYFNSEKRVITSDQSCTTSVRVRRLPMFVASVRLQAVCLYGGFSSSNFIAKWQWHHVQSINSVCSNRFINYILLLFYNFIRIADLCRRVLKQNVNMHLLRNLKTYVCSNRIDCYTVSLRLPVVDASLLTDDGR